MGRWVRLAFSPHLARTSIMGKPVGKLNLEPPQAATAPYSSMTAGLYTLANDTVYDQLVALLNSVEANAEPGLPVCVIAYDERLERVKALVDSRPNVTLLDDAVLFADWEEFSYQVWRTHPTALADWRAKGIQTRFYRVGENHRYVAFDARAPFDHFVYVDADALILSPLTPMFEALAQADVAIYDFQFKHPDHIFNLQSPRLPEVITPQRLTQQIFCSGFFGARRDGLPPAQRQWLLSQLQAGDGEVLYPSAPNQSLLNYMVHKSERAVTNLVFTRPADTVTGNSVTSPHFRERDHVLYDHGARLMFLHYIGISSKHFRALCQGENVDFPYRDLFLHYRYRSGADHRPDLVGQRIPYRPPTGWRRYLKPLAQRLP